MLKENVWVLESFTEKIVNYKSKFEFHRVALREFFF